MVLGGTALSICPAYAGMIPECLTAFWLTPYLSRVCGDDPGLFWYLELFYKFVPRMRG